MNFGESGASSLEVEDYVHDESDEEVQIDEYDLTATPNDFNILTIYSFIESGAVKIPGFQRNYVWDQVRASKLIESLILGLPVPQVFLYEESRNSFLVIDGQQRLMSLYYFIKQRFPLKEKRTELRQIFDREGKIPDEILHDDRYFSNFSLRLPSKLPDRNNRFDGLNYSRLGSYKTQFELRPIRNVIIKQNSPKDDNSSVYEIFNRLNTGGINLSPQEIRASLYHSRFYSMVARMNADRRWRRLLGASDPDLHMKDVEILLRAFAFLIDGEDYAPSMTRFLNRFSNKARSYTDGDIAYLEQLLSSFLDRTAAVPGDVFRTQRNKRFSTALFEAVFAAATRDAYRGRNFSLPDLRAGKIRELEVDQQFVEASQERTTSTTNVQTRLRRAREILLL